jgi:hypothetical protein
MSLQHCAALALVGWYLMVPISGLAATARPKLLTYTNKAYGFSFRYRRDWIFKEGDQVNLNWGYLGLVGNSLPHGVTVMALELPFSPSPSDQSFSQHGIVEKFLKVTVDAGLTPVECNRSAFHGLEELQPTGNFPTVKVGAVQFTEAEEDNAGLGHKAFARYYHVFQNRICYEFQLGLNQNFGSPDEIEDGFAELKYILATVTIRPTTIAPPLSQGKVK